MQVGDFFELPEEGVAGLVTDVFYDADGETALSCVVQAISDGSWYAIDLTPKTVTVH